MCCKRLLILCFVYGLNMVFCDKEPFGLYVPKYDPLVFHQFYDALIDDDVEKQLAGIREIKKKLASPNPEYDGFERTGVLQRLVECLHSENNNVEYESALVIANLCSKGYSHLIVEAGGIIYLIDTLGSRNMTIVQQGVLALGYIMGHNPDYRDHCVVKGVVFKLSWLVSSKKTPDDLLKNVSWAISNLCKETDEYVDEEDVKQILPALALLIQHKDPEVVQHAIWAYAYLAAGGGKYIQTVIESGRFGNIVALLNHTNEKIQYAAAGAVAILFTGNAQQIQKIIDQGALQHLVKLLIHPSPELKKNAVLAVYKLVTYGKPKHVQAMLNLNIVSLICDLLDNCSRIVVKTSMDIIHVLLGKSDGIREIVGEHINEWGGLEKMENIMEQTISRLHNEDMGIDEGTCSR